MALFLVVDDDPTQRKLISGHIEIELEQLGEAFTVKAIHPLTEANEYFQFIEDEDVSLLILDEKLKNQPDKDGKFAKYFGHDLAAIIRTRHKDLPIYTVTNYPEVPEIEASFADYDQIINRRDFYKNAGKYIPAMLRAAGKFVDRYTKDLSEFTTLSQAVASGDDSIKTAQRLQAIQSSVELPVLGYDDRQSWLKEYERQIGELNRLKDELNQRLKK